MYVRPRVSSPKLVNEFLMEFGIREYPLKLKVKVDAKIKLSLCLTITPWRRMG